MTEFKWVLKILKARLRTVTYGEENMFPLISIAVFGNAAFDLVEGLVNPPKTPQESPDIGVLTIDGCAGTGRNSYAVSSLEAIKEQAKQSSATIQYNGDNDIIAANDFRGIYPRLDVCLVFVKPWAAETYDRSSFELSFNSTLLVSNVAKLRQSQTIVITNSGGTNSMPWSNNPDVTAILATHYPGQETGNSIVDVLLGKDQAKGETSIHWSQDIRRVRHPYCQPEWSRRRRRT
jgi:beta-glucosidase